MSVLGGAIGFPVGIITAFITGASIYQIKTKGNINQLLEGDPGAGIFSGGIGAIFGAIAGPICGSIGGSSSKSKLSDYGLVGGLIGGVTGGLLGGTFIGVVIPK
jgi:hypothetical protein